ncbi:MAG: AAA family ATPase [Candidatus Aenigmatarchaeota archaeon]
MVYIKKIILQGFKSFNRKTIIPFIKGLNVIVGPNGSGKSNIIDAICFVLGKISAKQMRADKLSELIFRGNEYKKPAEIASVSIIFDNSDRIFPIDSDEVIITRKVNRKGHTLYKINDKTETRERVLEILSFANLRPDGFNIILQGDVTRIIEMSEEERREIIDQLSGIYEYNQRKEKAMQDLERIEQRLKELELIISEKYKRYKELEEQRNLALKYKELEREIKIVKKSLLIKKIEEIDKQIEELKKSNEEIEQKVKELAEKILTLDEQIDKKEKEIEKILRGLKNLANKEKESNLKVELEIKKAKYEYNKKEIERLLNIISSLESFRSEKELPLAVKEVLSLGINGVYGTIADLMKVDPKYQVAIEVAAANHLYDIVVENFEVAKTCIEYLKREKIGRATFLPLDKLNYKRLDEKFLEIEGVIGIASDLIEYDKKFEPAFEFVFGNTLVIENLDVAKAIGIGKVRMVTLDGDLIERSGAITGGYFVKKVITEASKTKEIEKYREQIRKLEEENKLLEEEIKSLESELKKIKPVEIQLIPEIDEKELENLRKERRKLFDEKLNLQNKISNNKIKIAKLEAEKERYLSELEEFREVEDILNESIEKLTVMLDKLQYEIKSLGTINFKAIEEFEKIKEEFENLKQKFDKVKEEKEKVIQMINEIERKRREIFFNTLNLVSEKFNELFNRVVGGEAKLELEDYNNLDSGLLIKVKFPNKGYVDLDSLSGGEKTLVALLFLLSLQMIKPVAFYAMDEIDAALDKVNSEKIANLLKEISKQTQIIVITHNDITVKYADTLYGVTMEEGESKILSLKIAEYASS